MNYTILILIALGLVGVLLHNLFKLNELKKSNPEGDVNYSKYFKMESISIVISVITVVLFAIFSQQVDKLYNAGEWLMPAFVPIGYFSQSLLIKALGKAQKVLDTKTDANS